MQKCDYCGRENPQGTAHCQECGTELALEAAAKKPTQPHDRTWLEWLGLSLRLAAALLVIGLVYLLSFGPVERYCGRTVSQTPMPTTVAVNGQTAVLTSVRRVSYPRWVGVVYHPILRLRRDGIYGRYPQWWEER